MRKKRKGFTLIELMVAVAVVGILAAVVYPSYVTYKAKGRQAHARSGLGAVRLSMEQYHNRVGWYPASGASLSQYLTGFDPSEFGSSDGKSSYTFRIVDGQQNSFRVEASGNIDDDPFLDIWEVNERGIITNTKDGEEHSDIEH